MDPMLLSLSLPERSDVFFFFFGGGGDWLGSIFLLNSSPTQGIFLFNCKMIESFLTPEYAFRDNQLDSLKIWYQHLQYNSDITQSKAGFLLLVFFFHNKLVSQ